MNSVYSQQGWSRKPLAEVCLKIQDGAHKSPQNQYEEAGDNRFLYITSKNIRNGYMKLDKISYCDASFHDEIFPRCNVELGDVLLTKDGASTGNVCLNEIEQQFSMLSSVCLIKPDRDLISSKFIYYYLRSDEGFRQITGKMTGAAIKRIILKTIKAAEIPFPPPKEQSRIVAILDEVFESLAQAQANTEKNLANAQALNDSWTISLLTNVHGDRVKLGDHADVLTGFAFKSKEYTADESGIKLLRGDNIMQGYTRWENVKRWPALKRDGFEKFELAAGDVIVAMDRTWVTAGIKRTQIKEEDLPCLLLQRVARLRASDTLLQNYLNILFSSKLFEQYVLDIQTGLGVPHISATQIKDFSFNLPLKSIQSENIDRWHMLTRQVEILSRNKKLTNKDLLQLKSAILQKAFSGELTNNPDKLLNELGA